MAIESLDEFYDVFKWEILGDTAFEDVQGLREPLWLLRGHLNQPQMSEVERQELAERALRELHRDGLIYAFRPRLRTNPGDAADLEPLRLSPHEFSARHWTATGGEAPASFLLTIRTSGSQLRIKALRRRRTHHPTSRSTGVGGGTPRPLVWIRGSRGGTETRSQMGSTSARSDRFGARLSQAVRPSQSSNLLRTRRATRIWRSAGRATRSRRHPLSPFGTALDRGGAATPFVPNGHSRSRPATSLLTQANRKPATPSRPLFDG